MDSVRELSERRGVAKDNLLGMTEVIEKVCSLLLLPLPHCKLHTYVRAYDDVYFVHFNQELERGVNEAIEVTGSSTSKACAGVKTLQNNMQVCVCVCVCVCVVCVCGWVDNACTLVYICMCAHVQLNTCKSFLTYIHMINMYVRTFVPGNGSQSGGGHTCQSQPCRNYR